MSEVRIRQLTHLLMSVSRGAYLRPRRRQMSQSSDTIQTIDPGTISFKSSVIQHTNNRSNIDTEVRTRSLRHSMAKPSVLEVLDEGNSNHHRQTTTYHGLNKSSIANQPILSRTLTKRRRSSLVASERPADRTGDNLVVT